MNILASELTPALIVDRGRLEKNLKRMQEACDRARVQLWPHIKTHKCVAIARRQLELGATGLTCAKLSEAEALMPSGVRRIFLAHSLSTPSGADRAGALQQRLDQLVLAVTSLAHARALSSLLAERSLSFPVALAIDTGLGREGLRTLEEARELEVFLRQHTALRPIAIYTHEGHSYSAPPEQRGAVIEAALARLIEFRSVLGNLPLWPGCSVTALDFAQRGEGIGAVRPGSYVFGDLSLAETTGVLSLDDVALTIRSTVVDRPTRDLALIDAGSKTFSSDRTAKGIFARAQDGRSIAVTRLSEEHGFVTGPDVDHLAIGQAVDWIPAHVCPTVNLARRLYVISGGDQVEIWPIEASGCNY